MFIAAACVCVSLEIDIPQVFNRGVRPDVIEVVSQWSKLLVEILGVHKMDTKINPQLTVFTFTFTCGQLLQLLAGNYSPQKRRMLLIKGCAKALRAPDGSQS